MTSFIKGSVNALREQKDKLKKNMTYEVELESKMRETISKRIETEKEIDYIEKNIKLGGKGIMDEIDLVEKLPFIEKVELDTTGIILKYKTTCLKVNEFDREAGKSYGKRTFYLGSLTFKITPQQIQLMGEVEGAKNCHPHSTGYNKNYGNCCFGDTSTEGRKKIFESLAMNRFSAVANLLWFWIKTYISGSAYSHYPNYYDDLLSCGIPIWDEKGERIKLNDPDRMKTGEQRQLDKRSCYENNIKKYADTKIC